MMNSLGDVLHISCLQIKKTNEEYKPKYYPSKTVMDEKGEKTEQIHRIEFPRAMQDSEFAYCGDYFCWKHSDSKKIYYVNIAELGQLANMNKSLRIGTGETGYEAEIREIDLSDYIEDGKEHLVSIEKCEVAKVLKQSMMSVFDCNARTFYQNAVEVCIRNRVILFNLEGEIPRPVEDHEATD